MKIVMNFLLLLPFCNTCVKRVCNVLNNSKIDNRNRLKIENVRALLYTQDAMWNEGGCSKFTPSDKNIKMAIWN